MKINQSFSFKVLSLFLIAAFLNLAVACNYYRIRSLNQINDQITKANLSEAQQAHKYLFLHCNGIYHISGIELDQSKMTMTCTKEVAGYLSMRYDPVHPAKQRYSTSDSSKKVLDEVHIFANTYKDLDGSKIEIPLSAISKIDVIEKDSGRTTSSYIAGTIGIIFGIFAIVLIIALLTKSSCPFIYVKDGQYYVFKGELFGGAIFKPLERDDYIGLKTLQPGDSTVDIKITNELKERQYTDIAELMVAERNANEQTTVDSKGKIHIIRNTAPPTKAILNSNMDYTKQVSALDSNSCLFNQDNSLNELVLTFNKPVSKDKANLVLNTKNSLWLDFAFGQLTSLFGVAYDKWIQHQRTANRDTLMDWSINQHLPLSVFIKKNNQWQLVEYIPTIGPLASRDLCIPLDLSGIDSDKIEVKLSCGFMFWEVDYAGIDFSTDQVVNVQTLKPFTAVDESGNNVKNQLSFADKDYLSQPGPGFKATITYKLPARSKDKQYDVYMHTRGYYEHIRNYTGLPDKKLLESFKKPGAFTDFSKGFMNS